MRGHRRVTARRVVVIEAEDVFAREPHYATLGARTRAARGKRFGPRRSATEVGLRLGKRASRAPVVLGAASALPPGGYRPPHGAGVASRNYSGRRVTRSVAYIGLERRPTGSIATATAR